MYYSMPVSGMDYIVGTIMSCVQSNCSSSLLVVKVKNVSIRHTKKKNPRTVCCSDIHTQKSAMC